MKIACKEAGICNVTFQADGKRQGENGGREAATCALGDPSHARRGKQLSCGVCNNPGARSVCVQLSKQK